MFDTEAIQQAAADRHYIHQHPELQYEEHGTAALVAQRLSALGYEVKTGVAGTGVLATLDTERAGAVIALRADMDALPIEEANDLPYRSEYSGKMHACGHDGHTATLLLAATEIMRRKAQLSGVIKLIFQPAEEGGNGAEKMVKAGVLENPRVDAVFGYHNRPGYETGAIFAKAGSTMGGNDTFYLTLQGRSGHSAMPHLAVDPIYLGAAVIMQLQGIVSRAKSPLKAGVISVTGFEAGNADNIIPETAKIIINIRSDSAESHRQLVGKLEDLIAGVCAPFEAEFRLEHIHHIPPLENHRGETERALRAIQAILPQADVQQIDYMPTMGAEDFAYYLQERPGCFFFVGNGIDSAYLHNHRYDFNDAILPTAAAAFVGIVEDYCGKGA